MFISELFKEVQGRNLIDPSLQDNVIIQSGFFQHIYHIGCAFNLHSIINNGLIPGGQDLSRRQTVFFLPIDPRDESHKDPDDIDLNAPRHAQYLHTAWQRHQDAVYWVDVNLAIEKGLQFYQSRSNAIILQETLPAFCSPKVVRMKTGEVFFEKEDMSPRSPPKISFKHEWKRELGSEVARQPEGEVARQAKSSQPTQPTPNPIRERWGRLDNMQDGSNTYLSQEINVNSFCEELSSSERTGRLVATLNTADATDSSRARSPHESNTFNVEDKYFVKEWAHPLLIMTRVMNQLW